MKKRILLIAVVLLAALSVGAVIYLNTPRAVARNAVVGVADDLLDRAEIKPLVKLTQKGSVSLSAEVDTGVIYNNIYGGLYEGRKTQASFGGTLYFGKNKLFLKDAYVELSVPEEGISFDAEADLFIGKKYAYLESDLVGGAVGLIKGEMTEALKGSELAPELPEELYRELLPAMKRYDGIDDGSDGEAELLKQLFKLVSSFEKSADYTSLTREVLLQGESVKCRVVTITLDRESLLSVLETLSEILADETVKNLLDENQWYLQPLLVRVGLLSQYAVVETLSSYLAEGVNARIEALERGEECGDWRIEIVTPRRSSKLLSFALFARDEKIFSLDFGSKGVQKTECVTLTMGDSVYTYSTYRTAVRFGASLSCQRGEEVQLLFSLDFDEESDYFCLFWREDDRERFVTGNWHGEEGRTTLVTETFCDNEGKWDDAGFSVEMTFAVKDTMPKALNKKEVRNIFDLTRDDVWKIITGARGLILFVF